MAGSSSSWESCQLLLPREVAFASYELGRLLPRVERHKEVLWKLPNGEEDSSFFTRPEWILALARVFSTRVTSPGEDAASSVVQGRATLTKQVR